MVSSNRDTVARSREGTSTGAELQQQKERVMSSEWLQQSD
jgi:hypothetical protein